MVTIAQAQSQVQQAREGVKGATIQAQQRQAEIKSARAKSQKRFQRQRGGTISQQVALAKQVGKGSVGQEIKKRRVAARKEFEETGRRLSKAEEELGLFRTQITGRESQIRGIESQISRARGQEAKQREIREQTIAAIDAVSRGSLKPGASKLTRRLFEQALAGRGIQPTLTELSLGISLPADIRGLPSSEVSSGQSFIGGLTLTPSIKIQSLAPIFQPRVVSDLGGVILSRQEFQDIGQQSLPSGTTGFAPSERVQSFDARESFFGGTGQQFVGINISPKIVPSLQPKDVSARDIQALFRQAPGTLGFPVRVVGELIPTTPGEVGITAGLIGATIFAPPVVGTIVSGGVGVLGIRGVLDRDLTIEQRTSSGIIGGLGVGGVFISGTPFIRGFFAKGVRTAPEGFEIIPGIRGIGEIGLIQPGRGATSFVDLPTTSPLVRGGFGVRGFEKGQFLGEQFLTTSQRGLFQVGKDIPIERPFFVTPQEPTLGIPETRVSRLGLTDFFKFPEQVEIGFGIPPTPQIGVTRAVVSRTERGGAFAIGKGTELEAIRSTGLITDIQSLGRARIRGQGIDLFTFETTPGRTILGGRPSSRIDFISTRPSTRVTGETVLTSLFARPTRGITGTFGTRALISTPIFGRTTRGISPPTTPPFSPPSPSIRTPSISPPTSPPTLSPFSLRFGEPIFPEPPPRKRRGGKRKPPKRRKELDRCSRETAGKHHRA
ncbi:hypothetical protein LCGC14_1257170 [marine sediment metagenome]|uniref:Uncharacterized protein n=1 Tax=marine sediment metagenome TaxID=412755 RepID=A0A0F9LN37_9ZZZZ